MFSILIPGWKHESFCVRTDIWYKNLLNQTCWPNSSCDPLWIREQLIYTIYYGHQGLLDFLVTSLAKMHVLQPVGEGLLEVPVCCQWLQGGWCTKNPKTGWVYFQCGLVIKFSKSRNKIQNTYSYSYLVSLNKHLLLNKQKLPTSWDRDGSYGTTVP